jgi:hypothetical protein
MLNKIAVEHIFNKQVVLMYFSLFFYLVELLVYYSRLYITSFWHFDMLPEEIRIQGIDCQIVIKK